jgi:hypothetical protein
VIQRSRSSVLAVDLTEVENRAYFAVLEPNLSKTGRHLLRVTPHGGYRHAQSVPLKVRLASAAPSDAT